MLEKLDKLEEEGLLLLANQREHALNKIDKEAMELLLSAEKHRRKLITRAISFSPELSKKGLIWRF